MITDLTLPSDQQVLALLNNHLLPFVGFTFDDITFQIPVALAEGTVRNTSLDIVANNTSVYKGFTTIWYNRINLQRLSPGITAQMLEPEEYTKASILAMFNQLYETNLQEADIEDFVIPDSQALERTFTMVAKPGSYAWIGSLDVEILVGGTFLASEDNQYITTEDDLLIMLA